MLELIGLIVVLLLCYLIYRYHVLHISIAELRKDWAAIKATGKPL